MMKLTKKKRKEDRDDNGGVGLVVLGSGRVGSIPVCCTSWIQSLLYFHECTR